MLTALLVALSLTAPAAQPEYCAGWTQGYKAGWCYRDTYCIAPIPPTCPLCPMGRYAFQDGYQDGFVEGLQSRH